MQKTYIFVLVLVVVMAVGAAWYFFGGSNNDYGPPRPPQDLTGVVVEPVAFPLKGYTFQVPDLEDTTVKLDLVAPSARRDYPMGKFSTTTSAGVVNGSLVALEDLLTENHNGRRAVPISIDTATATEPFYLAIVTDDNNGNLEHIASLPIGNNIRIRSVTAEGDQVSVVYLTHDRGQDLAAVPKIETTAVFDIANVQILQRGRDPRTEEYVAAKKFTGTYLWRDTEYADGRVVAPVQADAFALTFNANRIELATDCNSGSATFAATTGSSTSFTVDAIASTKMFCDSAQETEYFEMISAITDYEEAADGVLIFDLNTEAKMNFVPQARELPYENNSDPALEGGE